MLKVEELPEDIQQKIIKLKTNNWSDAQVADLINNEYNQDLVNRDISIYMDKKENKVIKILKEDKELQEKTARMYFDTIMKLNTLHDEMWEFFYDLRKNPEYQSKKVDCPHCGKNVKIQVPNHALTVKAADHIMKQIDHVDKIAGRLKNTNVNVTYNVTDMADKISTILPMLYAKDEQKGYIKIKKKKKKKEIEN